VAPIAASRGLNQSLPNLPRSMIIALRIIHVLGGIFWVGAMLFMTFFLFPAVAEAGPGAGPVMGGLQRRKMMVVIPIVATLTLISGFWLFYLASGGEMGHYARTRAGHAFSVGGGLAVVAFLIGMFVSRPAGMRAMRLGQQLAGAAEVERAALMTEIGAVQKRAATASMIVASLLLLAATSMAIARYL
jgi:uncharacterized membrane protein